jgi:hypothetical protein
VTSVIDHAPIEMRARPVWVAAQLVLGAAMLAAGLAVSSPFSAIGVFWIAWGLSTLADRIRVEDMVLHRRSFFGTPPPLELGRLTKVALTRWTGSRNPVPPLVLVLDADGSRQLEIALRKWTNSKELARLVARATVAPTSDGADEPTATIEMSERTTRRLRELL